MNWRIKILGLQTGASRVVVMNRQDAKRNGFHASQRLALTANKRRTTGLLDVTSDTTLVPQGTLGIYDEVRRALKARSGARVHLRPLDPPASHEYIKKKLDGKCLTYPEYFAIMQDMVAGNLHGYEIAAFVLANYTRGLTQAEVVAQTRAMALTGETLKFKKHPVVDLHCIGGIAGNRTSLVVVPIAMAAGVMIPKTSSRAITSPSGTIDTLEVLCPVELPIKKLYAQIHHINGALVWGGGDVHLAPADDIIIGVEHPLNIDAEAQMLSSIMAKKLAAGITHLLLDIPYGKEAKVRTLAKAKQLGAKFVRLGRSIGIDVELVFSHTKGPIGVGIGPVLEARDCLNILRNRSEAPEDLRAKSLFLAGQLLELAGKVPEGAGVNAAEKILTSGLAFEYFEALVKQQGGSVETKLRPAKHQMTLKAQRGGRVAVSNSCIVALAKMLGAPQAQGAGVDVFVQTGQQVAKNTPLLTLYTESKSVLGVAKQRAGKAIQLQ